MNKYSFKHQFLPVITVFIVMAVSFTGYSLSRYINNYIIHQVLSAILGTAYFLSVALGALYIYTILYIRGISIKARILSSAINPFIWMTKEVIRITESHPLIESLYWYLNPLHIWLVSFMVVEMGIGTLIGRWIMKRKGTDIPVVTAAPICVITISLVFAISLYAWGKGENIYVMFLEGYRFLFGSGL